MERERPTTEYQAVAELHLRHWEQLQGSSVVRKVREHGARQGHGRVVADGWPIVLGSEHDGVRHLLLAFRQPRTDIESSWVVSNYFAIGTCMGDVIMPNRALGISDEEFRAVDELYAEAVQLQATTAPHYSLESGLIREREA